MSITPPTGILDITDAIVRVSKLEFRGATGFDTILNNVARNTILLVDQNVEYVADKAWGLKLPNAWVSEFEAYWASGASGNIDFNIYNNTTSGTNGYVISMDDTTITVTYDGGSALETVSLGSTLRNDTWRKIHILFERDMISLALDGTRVLYFKDTLIRPRVYDEDSGYVVAAGLSANRKVKNLRILNGDKWMTDNSSNIAYVHGNVGIGTTQAAYTLDVAGDIRATGNLLIEGLTTTVDTQNLSIEDAIVEIGRGNDGGTSGKDVGFLFTRNNGANTTNSNVALIYDESTDRLTFGYSDGSPTDSTLAINTSKSLDVVIPSGNLGIGTASPSGKLQIRSGSSSIYATDSASLISNAAINISSFLDPSDYLSIGLLGATYSPEGNNPSAYMQVQWDTTGTPLTSSILLNPIGGNVGIGTTDPTQRLAINGATLSYAAPGGEHQGIRVTNENVNYGSSAGIGMYVATAANAVPGASVSGTLMGDIDTYWANGSDAYMRFFVSPTNSTTPGDAKMVIKNNGNVGIGTASPNDKVEIYGATDSTLRIATDTGQAQLLLRSGATTRRACRIDFSRADTGTQYMNIIGDYQQNATDDLTVSSSTSGRIMTWLQNGNVGIGTASPGTKLHVQSVGTGTTVLITGPTQGNSGGPNNDPWTGLEFQRLGTNGETYNGSVNLRAYRWATSGQDPAMALRFNLSSTAPYNTADVMTLRSDGNVGIGVTNPGFPLQVIGRHGFDESGYWARRRVGTGNPNGTTRIYYRNFSDTDNISMYVNQLYSANDASDDRIKTDEVLVENATQTLLKLKPQTYTKDIFEFDELTSEEYSNTASVDGYVFSPTHDRWRKRRFAGRPKKETGLIIQDIWYDTPELRHIIRLADDAEPTEERPNIEDIQQDPDYDALGWGQDASHLMYQQLIPYLIKSNQELYTEIQAEKTKTTTLETKLQTETAALETELQAEKAKVAALETQLASVLARLDALESA
jgi:hypothetical protein